MFGFFNNKNTEAKKQEIFQKTCDEVWESYYARRYEYVRKDLRKYEFFIETLYKTKNINVFDDCHSDIDEKYTNKELIKELGIFNDGEEKRLIMWINKYNEIIRERTQIMNEYKRHKKEMKEKLDEIK